MIKNDLLLKALRQEKVERPPVWMMRQAGRYLPDYIKLKEKYTFFERVKTPELAAEITIMPVHQIGVDAAILFSDILVVPLALGFDIELVADKGPVIYNNIKTAEDAYKITLGDVVSELQYVFDGVKATKEGLNDEVPLIGFAGAPWTIFCYVIEGHGSKTFSKAKGFCFEEPEAAKYLLQVITDATILYLQEKVKAGIDALQLFDSWGGLLSPEDYDEFSFPYMVQIIDALKDKIPVIAYPKGCWYNMDKFAQTGVSAIGIDWLTSAAYARAQAPGITIQGNLDPLRLLSPIKDIQRLTKAMIDEFGVQNYIANLGHGISPEVPVDHAKAFVDAVKSYRA
jgi:uroporphyrinogen decarboxylase